MSKIVLDDVISGYNLTKVNENFQKIEDELNNKVLYRDNPVGEPNSIEQDIDLNGKKLLNAGGLEINGLDIAQEAQAAANSAAAAAVSEANAAVSETNAEAALSDFKNRYQGPYAVAPTLRTDGSPLQEGDLYFSTVAPKRTKVWDGSMWINAGSVIQAYINKPDTPVIATAGQTIIPVPNGYDSRYIDVWVNGFKVDSPEIDISSGVNIVFSTPLNVNDEVTWIAFSAIQVSTQQYLSLSDYPTLKDAITALGPNGGVIRVPVGRFKSGDWDRTTNYMYTPNVTLIGDTMPRLSPTADRLEGGSIIEGRFNVFAHGFTAINVGFDLGKYVMDTYYASYDSTVANHPNGGDWTAFSFGTNDSVTPAAPRRNVHIQNVIGLLSRPLSNGHAVIMEAIDGFFADNVVGVYGIHGVVIKAKNGRIGSIAGYMASTDNVIIKSDSYAISGNLQIDSITSQQYAPNITPWIAPTKATYGLFVNPATASFSGPVQIGKLKSISCGRGMLIRGTAGNTVSDFQIGQVYVEDAATLAIGADTSIAYRCTIGELIANTVGVGIAWQFPDVAYASENQLSIGACQLTNVANWAIAAQGYARVKIDDLKVKTAGYAYYNEDNARILIGKEQFSGVVTKWYTSGLSAAPSRSISYSDAAGYIGFDVSLENYQVVVRGALRYDGGGTPTQNATLASFPPYLRPPTTQLLSSVKKSGTAYSSIGLGVTSGGSITHNEGNSLPTVNDVVVCNSTWKHY